MTANPFSRRANSWLTSVGPSGFNDKIVLPSAIRFAWMLKSSLKVVARHAHQAESLRNTGPYSRKAVHPYLNATETVGELASAP